MALKASYLFLFGVALLVISGMFPVILFQTIEHDDIMVSDFKEIPVHITYYYYIDGAPIQRAICFWFGIGNIVLSVAWKLWFFLTPTYNEWGEEVKK